MGKPLLLGETPSARDADRWDQPLYGNAAHTLLRLLEGLPFRACRDCEYERLREVFDCLNAVERRENAFPWRVQRARDRWSDWVLALPRGEPLVVVCLGRRAQEAVGLSSRRWGVWVEAGLLEVTVIPHPSGLNRAYNDPAMRQLAHRVLHQAVGRAWFPHRRAGA